LLNNTTDLSLVIHPAVKKKRVLPKIAPEDMTPQVAAMLVVAEEALRLRDAAYEEGVALRKELAQLKRAKKRALRASK
jgi:hypothetical protein